MERPLRSEFEPVAERSALELTPGHRKLLQVCELARCGQFVSLCPGAVYEQGLCHQAERVTGMDAAIAE